jgi:hypothetical protein
MNFSKSKQIKMKTLTRITAIFFAILFMASCTKESVEDCICPSEYLPVYDQSGNEYTNACLAECAGVEYFEQSPETLATIWRNPTLPANCQWLIRIKDKDYRASNLDKDLYLDGRVITISYKADLVTSVDDCGSVDGLISIETLRLDQ